MLQRSQLNDGGDTEDTTEFFPLEMDERAYESADSGGVILIENISPLEDRPLYTARYSLSPGLFRTAPNPLFAFNLLIVKLDNLGIQAENLPIKVLESVE
jgi:hypothetical protein